MVGEATWVAGGQLGTQNGSAQEFKQIILDLLQKGETVTKCALLPCRLHVLKL